MRTSWAWDRHGVAITVEPVALADRRAIRLRHGLVAAEGAYQHEQGRAGQVKIGEQPVDGPERIGRVNEQLGLPRGGVDSTPFVGARLERADDGRAHGPDPAARSAPAVDDPRGLVA